MAGRRLDWIERILRFVRGEMFYRVARLDGRLMRRRMGVPALSSVILFFPSHNSSRPVRVSRFSISWPSQQSYHLWEGCCNNTLILLAASSRFLKFVKPSRFSILVILFCTKYMSLSSFRWLTRRIILILLKLRSRPVRFVRSSRPLICAIRLS